MNDDSRQFIVLRVSRLVLFALTLFLCAVSSFALEVPPAPTQWFTDSAGLLSPSEGEQLNQKLRSFEQTSGAQFLIYVFPALEGESVEDFTIRCVERWKVGQKKYDNGLVLFVFVAEKTVRVEVGYGLEGTMTDAFSSRVIREQIAPAFQQGQYAIGLNAAADAVIKKISTGEEPVPPFQQPAGEPAGELGILPVLFILFIVFFVILPMLRRRGGGCGGCVLPFIFPGGGVTLGGGGFGSGGGFSGGGFGGGGGFSGGGGGFGGGGATGGW